MMSKVTESELYYTWINTFQDEITSWGPSLPSQAFTNLLQKQKLCGENIHIQAELSTEFSGLLSTDP